MKFDDDLGKHMLLRNAKGCLYIAAHDMNAVAWAYDCSSRETITKHSSLVARLHEGGKKWSNLDKKMHCGLYHNRTDKQGSKVLDEQCEISERWHCWGDAWARHDEGNA